MSNAIHVELTVEEEISDRGDRDFGKSAIRRFFNAFVQWYTVAENEMIANETYLSPSEIDALTWW